ncbi:transposase [Streptomyces sp. NPDC005408]|uniref:IS701 family transposase n=1 Tax=Streptomyces sp. NPDC005408 TaxID=3155341 RepID=UPI0033B4B3C2
MITRYPVHSPTSVDVERVITFADDLFAHLHRADQRRWAHTYLLGLLTVQGKKSVRRLAAAVTNSPTASQSLHQFINASPWAWQPARRELTRWVEQRLQPRAWTIGTAVLPKRGEHSCGVHRRFVPSLGRVVNCQVGIGLFLSDGRQEIPVDWRLLIPGQWSDHQLRRRAKIPDRVQPFPIWAHVLDLVDSQADRTSLAPVPLVANLRECQETGRLIRGLRQRGRDFVIAVPGSLPVLPESPLQGRQPQGPAAVPVLSAQQVLRLGSDHPHSVTVNTRDGQTRRARVVTGLVRLPHEPGNGAQPKRVYRVFSELHRGTQRRAAVWITNLVHRRMDDLLELAGLQAGTAHTLHELERDFGLQDFEGRSYPGWHHHITLVSAAGAHRRLGGTEPNPIAPALESLLV